MTAEIDGERMEIASISAVVTEYGYNFQYSLPDGTRGEHKIKSRAEICNFNACKNKAVIYGVCEKHKKIEE